MCVCFWKYPTRNSKIVAVEYNLVLVTGEPACFGFAPSEQLTRRAVALATQPATFDMYPQG